MKRHAFFLGAVLMAFVSALSYAQAPVPFINLPLMPDATAPGGAQFTLTVNGTGFVSNSVVNWNGSALATQFVNGSQLTAIVPAADIATANTGWVTVVNPPPGGGTSSVAFFTVTANTGNSVGFWLSSSPAAGIFPASVAVGDFNGDGKLDLAVADADGNTVSILLGDGAGNFALASSLAVGSYPWSVAVGDFNGDGKLDLAVASRGSYGNPGTVSILLGDGTGNFTLLSSLVTGTIPDSVAVGDFNGDGKLDLAVANGSSEGTVSILLGDGTGNFTLASSQAAGIYPQSVAVADFNGDGKLDLAVTDWNSTVSILQGDGTGNFTKVSSAPTGAGPLSVAVGDFNGDGKLDLAVATNISQTASILLGHGTGHFALASSPGAGANPNCVAVGDFNGDGKLDLAVANFAEDGTVSILLATVLAVTLSPTSLTFGTQLVGTSSNPQPVTLTNTGSATLDISKIAASGSFSQTNNCPSSVPPNGQCTINVTFRPHERGKHAGAVTITDNAANSPQTVPLTGVATAVSLVPSGLNFGDEKVGTTSSPQSVTLTNHGTAAVEISRIHFTGKNPRVFAQTNTCGTSVAAGGSCSISVTFTPESKGPKTATLDVGDNGGGSPQTVALSGSGT